MKFAVRARPCAFVGYVHMTQKIWRIWDLVIGKRVQESDIRFDESKTVNVLRGDTPESTVLEALIADSALEEREARQYTDTDYPGHIDNQKGQVLERRSRNIYKVIVPSAIESTEEEAAMDTLPELPALFKAPASSHIKYV